MAPDLDYSSFSLEQLEIIEKIPMPPMFIAVIRNEIALRKTPAQPAQPA